MYSAYDYAMKAAEKLGLVEKARKDIVKIVYNDKTEMFVKNVLRRHLEE